MTARPEGGGGRNGGPGSEAPQPAAEAPSEEEAPSDVNSKLHIQILWNEDPGERYRPEAPSSAPEAPSDVSLRLHIQIL